MTENKKNMLRDVMTTTVITIGPDQSVGLGLSFMEEQKISALVVAHNRKPLGIFTERALIQIRSDGEIDYAQPISQVMSSPPFTAPFDLDYREAYNMLLHHRIRHLVVTDHDGNLAGIVTGTDFLSHLGLEYFMEFKIVEQVMVRDVLTSPPSSSAFTAMKLMNERRISSLVIEDNGYPAGIVTERDLLRLIRSNKSLERIQLLEVMSHPVVTVYSDVSSHKAAQILLDKGLRRLVVTNSSGRCIGIITETDMIKGLRTSYTDHLKEVIHQQANQLKEIKHKVEEAAILDSMLQSAGDIAISIMDSDLHVLLHNQAAGNLYNTSADKIAGQSAIDLHQASGNLKEFEQAVTVADKDGRYEFVLEQERNNATHFLAVTLFCIRDKDNNKTGYGLIAYDITGQKKAVHALKKKKQEAEEANIALKVMLDQHTKTKANIEEQISLKLKELVHPYLDILRQSSSGEQQDEAISIIAAHINSITHSFTPKAKEMLLGLSPRETMIADLVRQGKTSKDIADMLNISLRTVEVYRTTLRKKIGINNKKISLRTYLVTNLG